MVTENCSFKIFAGNITVLLNLPVTTAYCEYRTFDRSKVLQYVNQSRGIKMVKPQDAIVLTADDYDERIYDSRRFNCPTMKNRRKGAYLLTV